jgi:hypothetical protein
MAGTVGATVSRVLNRLQYAMANIAGTLTNTTLASNDLILVADVSADYEQKNVTVANMLQSGLAMPRFVVNSDVAAAGSVLADAAQLTEGFSVVTGADGTKGVKLPATPVAGTIVWIKGTTAGVLKVWPDAAATINAIGSNGAISLTSGAMPAIFIAKSATQWYTFPLVAS